MPPRNKSNQKTSTSKNSSPMPTKASPKPTKTTTKKPAIRRKSKENRCNNSSSYYAAHKTEGHLKKEDYLVIIKWLKIKRNGDSCFGRGKAPAVGQYNHLL
ncbi:uncharacterized protein VP01_386g9 [Puccinia sorghi]|uniref:Uncharacterized protein n=1 Tax=Puccinia sorghi TaxID=27349 RepID=A0A0L6UUX0_9BASI|nr:uncharacterized protein VP01_386g9 [Puccinia sorghi]